MTRAPILLALPFLAGQALQGCGGPCDQMMAYDYLAVAIVDSSWADGSYELELDGDVELVCSVRLDAGSPADPSCDSDQAQLSWSARQEGPHLTVLYPLPEYLHLALLLDGVELATQVFEPQYEIDQPNGEGCGERISATEIWELDG